MLQEFWPLIVSLPILLILLLYRSKRVNNLKRILLLFTISLSITILSLIDLTFAENNLFYKTDYINVTLEAEVNKNNNKQFDSYYRNNFIFIDNSFSKDPVTQLTDRKTLGNLLRELRDSINNIDLIIVDILFNDIDKSNDSALCAQIQYFAEKNKIVIARPDLQSAFPGFKNQSTEDQDKVFGEVKYSVNNNVAFEQAIYVDDNLSLAYLAHSKLRKFPNNSLFKISDEFLFQNKPNQTIVKNKYVIPYFVTRDNIIGFKDDNIPSKDNLAWIYNGSDFNLSHFDMNVVNDSAVFKDLNDTLSYRKIRRNSRPQKNPLDELNIIVIGSTSDNDDSHLTPFGYLSGVEMIVNSLVYLQLGYLNNHFKAILIFFLLVFACTISYYYLKRATERFSLNTKGSAFVIKTLYAICKYFDEIFIIVIIMVWMNLTQRYILVNNIFFPLFMIFVMTKAFITAEDIKINRNEK